MTDPIYQEAAPSTNGRMEPTAKSRYCWAGQFVVGKDVLDAGCGRGEGLPIIAEAGAAEVTGVDIAKEAVAGAETHSAECGAAVVHGDLQDLPFPDDSFDLAVCFETIEHLASPDQGLAELRRVVRAGGMLIVSSSDPDDLRRRTEEHFKSVQIYLQRAWLASVIEPDRSGENGGEATAQDDVSVRRTEQPKPHGSTSAIAVGCDQEPIGHSLINLSESSNGTEGAAEQRLAEAERRALQAETTAGALRERLQETSAALVDANQELAQLPLVKHRLAEMYAQNADLRGKVDEVLESRSWRLTAFLRHLRRALRVSR